MTASYTLGTYRLIAELGHGGMADVYLAAVQGPVGSGFTKLAVVKKLRSHLAEDPEFVAMLMDEARITARLAHPNVVQLFEFGHVDEQYFLAIEYLEGQPLHRIERRAKKRLGRDVPRELYYAVVSDVLAGLHYAHQLSDYDGTALEIVHRDVTPHNVFVTYDGTVKVVDFGIAKACGRTTETQQGIVKGKVRYMSPEQAIGAHVDRRTDIFAAGVMLWNAVTGQKLWADCDDVAVAQGLYSGEYRASPRAVCPDVPVEIDAICRRALAFRRDDRYSTAEEMRGELEGFLGRAGADVRRELASSMQTLFEPDRAKLRSVLEASALTTRASVDAFTAGAHSAAVSSLRGSEHPPPADEQLTLVMPGGARPRSVPPNASVNANPHAPLHVHAHGHAKETPSVSAMAISAGATAPTSWRPSPPPPRKSKPAPPEPVSKRPSALVQGLVFATTAAVVVAVIVARGTGGGGTASVSRHVAGLTTEITTFSRDPRPKAERAPPEASSSRSQPVVARRSAPQDRAQDRAGPATAPSPAPANPATGGSGRGAPPKPTSPLDNADPWGVAR